MVNDRGWMAARCDLTVIPMRGWSRNYSGGHGITLDPTSPNIPRGTSPLYYVATGIVGELSGPERAIGPSSPIRKHVGSISERGEFHALLGSLDMPGVSFRPIFHGTSLTIQPDTGANLTALGIYMLAEMNSHSESVSPDTAEQARHFLQGLRQRLDPLANRERRFTGKHRRGMEDNVQISAMHESRICSIAEPGTANS